MRLQILGPEQAPGGRVDTGHPLSAAPNRSPKPHAEAPSSENVPAARFLADRNSLPAEIVTAVNAILAETGLTLEDLDAHAFLRAVMLARNGVSSGARFIVGKTDTATSLAEEASSIHDNLRALIAETNLPASVRQSLTTVAAAFDRILNGDPAAALSRLEADRFIDGILEIVRTRTPTDVAGMPQTLQSKGASTSTNLSTGIGIAESAGAEVQAAAADLRSALVALFARGTTGEITLDSALDKFVARLTDTGFTVSSGGSGTGVGMVMENLKRELHMIAGRFQADSPSPDMALAALVRRSGMSFEWRLLAWFRAGADPGRLRELLSDDLKGLALMILAERKKSRSMKNGGFTRLAERIGRFVDTVTKRQIDMALSRSRGSAEMPIDCSFGPGGGQRMFGVVRRESAEAAENRTDSFVITLTTSSLGEVSVRMVRSRNRLTIDVTTGTGEVISADDDMLRELADALGARGFVLERIGFGRRAGTESKARSPKRGSEWLQ